MVSAGNKKILGNNTFDIHQLNKQNRILYATFGYHNGEPLCSIMARKVKEIQDNEDGFGLWGTAIFSEYIDKVRKFCEAISYRGKDVYVFLEFTDSTAQEGEKWETDLPNYPVCTKIGDAGDNHYRNQNSCPVWTIEELAKNKDHHFTSFQDGNHIIYTLNLEKALSDGKLPIIVRGNPGQNTAFVVQKYYFFMNKFSRNALLSCYEGNLYNSDKKGLRN